MSADVVVLTDRLVDVERLCVPPRRQDVVKPQILPFDQSLVELVEAWAHALSRGSQQRGKLSVGMAAMLKWQFVNLLQYRAVFFSDVDVDLFLHTAGQPPPPSTPKGVELRRLWTSGLRGFLRSRAQQLVVSGDYHSPINTGVMVIKPNAQIFTRGVQIMQTLNHSRRLGFNSSGAPRDVVPLANYRKRMLKTINNTVMLLHNTWHFVGGDGSQGLFVYVYLVLLRNAVARPTYSSLRVHHFFGANGKPWGAKSLMLCGKFFDFMGNTDFAQWGEETPCVKLFTERRTCLSANLSAETCAACTRHGHRSSCTHSVKCPQQMRWAVL